MGRVKRTAATPPEAPEGFSAMPKGWKPPLRAARALRRKESRWEPSHVHTTDCSFYCRTRARGLAGHSQAIAPGLRQFQHDKEAWEQR